MNEPYARALRLGGGTLTLRPHGAVAAAVRGSGSGAGEVVFDVFGWCSEASALERNLLQGLEGPVLDIGCGPGRLLSAARSLGLTALGIDTSAEAVALACSRGSRALLQSVFWPVPQAGNWRSALLLDGNIGIGGNVGRLLRRSRQLITPQGTLLVEVDPDEGMDVAYHAVLEDLDGNLSVPFAWARTGRAGLESRAAAAGWAVSATERVQGRVFCRLSPLPDPARPGGRAPVGGRGRPARSNA
ncbi:methyltransferase domain-containing protein [Arthrobacter sp. ISL-5]|uniref:methyltransferase domain-containing protein n=1 Tax=Arthrobacter sp. ISL-5 TaxID=2819111 RepID=UPI0035A9127A